MRVHIGFGVVQVGGGAGLALDSGSDGKEVGGGEVGSLGMGVETGAGKGTGKSKLFPDSFFYVP